MARLLLENIFGSANQESGIETSALRGIIERSNLPSDLSGGESGDSTRFSFLKKVNPSSNLVLTTPAGDDQGGWTQWTELEKIPAITATEAGHVLIVSNMTAEVSATAVGGGSRLHTEARLMRMRGGDTSELERVIGYGPRHLPAASGQTSIAFSNSTNYASKMMVNIDEAQSGDIYAVQVRVVWQKTSGTIQVTFPSNNNFIEVAPLGGAAGSSNPRSDSEINTLITNFLSALPAGSLAALKTQLETKSDSDINSLIHTYLNSLNTTDITILKTALGVKTDDQLRTLIEQDLDSATVKRILENLPEKSVKADYLRGLHIDFGDSLPTNTRDLPDGYLFLVRGTGFVYVLKPSAQASTLNRNQVYVTPTNDIFLLDNGLPQDNYNDFVGRIENKAEGNSRQLEVFLRSDMLSDLNIDTTEDSNVKLYVEIGENTIALHRYPGSEEVRYPDTLENVVWTSFEAPIGTTTAITNNQRLTIRFYRDSAKTQPINIKPEFTYTGKTFQRVTGSDEPDLSNFLTRNQIEGLIKSEQDEGESLLDFNFTGASGSIDRAAVTESSALTNSFALGDSTIVIKKIVQFTHDNAIEITTSPTLYNIQSEPDEDLIELFKDIKIKINDLTLSFGAAIASVDSSGYSWDADENETYWQFDGREPGTVRVGNNKVEVFSPLEPYNYLPKGTSADNGRVLKWNNTSERGEWKPEAGLDQAVTSQLESFGNFEKALRTKVSLGSSSGINVTTPDISHNTGKRVPAQRAGKDDHYILAVAGQEYEFSAKQLYALPRSPIGTLSSINGLEFGDSIKFYIGRSRGTVQDFLFTSDTVGTYNITIYSYNIDLNDESRASTGTFAEKVEDTVTGILDTSSSEVAINHLDASNKIELTIKPGVIEPSNFRGDTSFGDRAVVVNGTNDGFRYVTPNRLIHNGFLNSMSITDTSTQNFPESAFSPSFNVTSETGYFVLDLTIAWSRGATAARLNSFGDSSLILNATVFTHTLVNSTARTQTVLGGVPAIQQVIYLGSTVLGEYTLYLSKGNDNILGHWEKFRYASGQSGQNRNWEFSRRLTMAFNAFIS